MLVPPCYRYCIDLVLDSWCPFLTRLSVDNALVCPTPFEPCHTFCVLKHLSALLEKMLVFLQSLPWVFWGGKHGGGNSLLPCLLPSFLFLVSAIHLLSFPQSLNITCIPSFFPLNTTCMPHFWGGQYFLSTFGLGFPRNLDILAKFWQKWHFFSEYFWGGVMIWAWERQRF